MSEPSAFKVTLWVECPEGLEPSDRDYVDVVEEFLGVPVRDYTVEELT